MISLLLDTHAALWFLSADPRLSSAARQQINRVAQQAQLLALSSISLVEVAYLEEKGRLPANSLADLLLVLNQTHPWMVEVAVDRTILAALLHISRAAVPDMPDRIIAATALHLGVPLVSRDRKLQASTVPTIW